MERTTLIFNHKSLIFILAMILPFTSCKEDKEIAIDLKVDKNTLEIVQGETAVISIESGNGNYTVSLSLEGIATAEIIGNTIQISATSVGQTALVIKDAAGESATIIIKVVSTSQAEGITPRFVWVSDTIELEKPNDWGFTLFSERWQSPIFPIKTICSILEWGNVGRSKSNGLLKIVKGGELIQSIHLTTISISDDSSLYYKIDFNKNDQNGRIVFPK
jgi:hypothetical protein